MSTTYDVHLVDKVCPYVPSTEFVHFEASVCYVRKCDVFASSNFLLAQGYEVFLFNKEISATYFLQQPMEHVTSACIKE